MWAHHAISDVNLRAWVDPLKTRSNLLKLIKQEQTIRSRTKGLEKDVGRHRSTGDLYSFETGTSSTMCCCTPLKVTPETHIEICNLGVTTTVKGSGASACTRKHSV